MHIMRQSHKIAIIWMVEVLDLTTFIYLRIFPLLRWQQAMWQEEPGSVKCKLRTQPKKFNKIHYMYTCPMICHILLIRKRSSYFLLVLGCQLTDIFTFSLIIF